MPRYLTFPIPISLLVLVKVMPEIEQMLFQGWSNSERLKLNTTTLILNTAHLFSFFLYVFFSPLHGHITLLTGLTYSEFYVAIISHVLLSLTSLILSFGNILYSSVVIFPFLCFSTFSWGNQPVIGKQDSNTSVDWLIVLTFELDWSCWNSRSVYLTESQFLNQSVVVLILRQSYLFVILQCYKGTTK